MSEWWTYRLSSFLLFSPRTYYRLFELYNAEIWPWQILAVLLGLAILVLLLRPGPVQNRIVAAVLAAVWLWVAWAYLYTRYASINLAAPWFAAAFALQALLLVLIGAAGGRLSLQAGADGARLAGLGLYLFALLIQPLIGPLVGRAWSQVEIFAVAPDPTVTATLGVLVLASGWSRWVLMAVPIAWCLLSGATAWAMGSPDALVMPAVAAVAVVAAALLRKTRPAAEGH